MSQSPRKPSPILPIAGAAMLLLAGYVGAYYAAVSPIKTLQTEDGRYLGIVMEPIYQGTPKFLDRVNWHSVFRPIHRLDRRIRPHVWEPTP